MGRALELSLWSLWRFAGCAIMATCSPTGRRQSDVRRVVRQIHVTARLRWMFSIRRVDTHGLTPDSHENENEAGQNRKSKGYPVSPRPCSGGFHKHYGSLRKGPLCQIGEMR